MIEAKSKCTTKSGWKSDSCCRTKKYERRSSVTNKVDGAKLIAQMLEQAQSITTTNSSGYVWGIAPAMAIQGETWVVSGVFDPNVHLVDDM